LIFIDVILYQTKMCTTTISRKQNVMSHYAHAYKGLMEWIWN